MGVVQSHPFTQYTLYLHRVGTEFADISRTVAKQNAEADFVVVYQLVLCFFGCVSVHLDFAFLPVVLSFQLQFVSTCS